MFLRSGLFKNPLVVWTAANYLGVMVLVLLLLLVPAAVSSLGLAGTALALTLPISLAQWLALRRFVSLSSLWVVSLPLSLLLAGWVLAWMPAEGWSLLGLDDESVLALTLGYAIAGVLIGLPQWLLLRRHFAGAVWWLVGSTVGLAGGFYLSLATDLINQAVPLVYLLVPLIYSLATGLVLMYLLGGRQGIAFTTPASREKILD